MSIACDSDHSAMIYVCAHVRSSLVVHPRRLSYGSSDASLPSQSRDDQLATKIIWDVAAQFGSQGRVCQLLGP